MSSPEFSPNNDKIKHRFNFYKVNDIFSQYVCVPAIALKKASIDLQMNVLAWPVTSTVFYHADLLVSRIWTSACDLFEIQWRPRFTVPLSWLTPLSVLVPDHNVVQIF
jgi:hypothetical protein